MLEGLLRVLVFVLMHVHEPEDEQRVGFVRGLRQNAVGYGFRVVQASLTDAAARQSKFQVGVLRRDGEAFFVERGRAAPPPRHLERVRKIKNKIGVRRIESEAALEGGDGLLLVLGSL